MIQLIKNEMIKLVYNKKLLFFLLLIFVMVLVPVLISFLTRIRFDSGQTYPMFLYGILTTLVLPIFLSVLVADMITEEHVSGGFSIILVHPVSRIKLLTAKAITLYMVILFILVFTLLLSYGIGTLFFGWGDQFIDRGIVYPTTRGILITAGSYIISSLPLLAYGLGVILLGLLFTGSGAVVAVSTSLVLVFSVAGLLVNDLQPFLISTYFISLSKLVFFYKSVPDIKIAGLVIFLYGLIPFIVSLVIIKRRNILY